MHPAAWLAWGTGGGFVAASTTNPFYLFPVLGAVWVVYSARGSGPAIRSFRIFFAFGAFALVTRTALVFATPYAVSSASLSAAALEGLRLGVLLCVFGAFNAVADPFRLLKLAPRRWHEPALAVVLALSIAPRTIAAIAKVREAQRIRGIDVSRLRMMPALAVPVLVRGMEDAATLAESMDARGHGRGRRSRYRPERWSVASAVTALLGAASATVFAVMAATGGATLSADIPLRWPEVSTAGLAACLLLAVPAFLPSCLRDRRDDRRSGEGR